MQASFYSVVSAKVTTLNIERGNAFTAEIKTTAKKFPIIKSSSAILLQERSPAHAEGWNPQLQRPAKAIRSPVLWNVEDSPKKGCFTYFCTLPEHDQTFPRYLPIHWKRRPTGIQKGYIKALRQVPTGINLSLESCSRALTRQRQDSSRGTHRL